MRVVISRATLKNSQVAAIDQEALSLVASILSNAQTILKKPKVELKEIQALKPAKKYVLFHVHLWRFVPKVRVSI